jgi:hypothetical protein
MVQLPRFAAGALTLIAGLALLACAGKAQAGVLTGTITLSPSCPVEPCDPKPAANVTVVIRALDGEEVRSVTTDAAGNYRAAVPSGTYRLEVRTDGAATAKSLPDNITLAAGGETKLDATIDNGIRSPSLQAPVAGATLGAGEATAGAPAAAGSGDPLEEDDATATGGTPVDGGNGTLVTQVPEPVEGGNGTNGTQVPEPMPVVTPLPEGALGIKIPAGMGALAGRIVRGPGCPVEGAGGCPDAAVEGTTVIVSTMSGAPQASAASDASGNYVVLLPAGTYLVEVRLTGIALTKDLPRTAVVVEGHVTQIDIRIDTGIR